MEITLMFENMSGGQYSTIRKLCENLSATTDMDIQFSTSDDDISVLFHSTLDVANFCKLLDAVLE